MNVSIDINPPQTSLNREAPFKDFDKIFEGFESTFGTGFFGQTPCKHSNEPLAMPHMAMGEPEARNHVFILYHAPCKDGFGAAWSHVQSVLKGKAQANTLYHYVPEGHHFKETAKLLAREDLHDLTIYYLDICPKRDTLVKLHSLARDVLVWDHHPSAERDVGDLPYTFFDLKRSGAGIAWDVFVNEKRPLLINCIEDGDLWRWTVPNSSPILTVLETRRFDFKIWTEFANELERNPSKIIELGQHYAEYRSIVQRIMTGRKVHSLVVGGMRMPAVNTNAFQSGVGNIIAKKPGPCGAVYYFNGQYWAFSLRSTDKGPDVSLIAEKYGGGGHRNAAGFRVDKLEDLTKILETIEPYTDEEIESFYKSDLMDHCKTAYLLS